MGSVSYSVEWLPEDDPNLIIAAKVWAYHKGARLHVGDIHFNGNEWMFIRITRDGEQVMDGLHYIPVDPDAENFFRSEHAKIVAGGDAPEAALAAYRVRRKLHRDESREIAAVGAVIHARTWWNEGYHLPELDESDAADAREDAERERRANCAHTFQGDDPVCPHCGTRGHVAETEFPCGVVVQGGADTCPKKQAGDIADCPLCR